MNQYSHCKENKSGYKWLKICKEDKTNHNSVWKYHNNIVDVGYIYNAHYVKFLK